MADSGPVSTEPPATMEILTALREDFPGWIIRLQGGQWCGWWHGTGEDIWLAKGSSDALRIRLRRLAPVLDS